MMNKRLEMNEEMMAQVNGGGALRLVPEAGTEMFASGLAEAATVALIDSPLMGCASGSQAVLAAY